MFIKYLVKLILLAAILKELELISKAPLIGYKNIKKRFRVDTTNPESLNFN
jgi:hypothetical protein